MKSTARASFRVATCHRLVTGHDTRNRGVMLITGAVTLVTWPVMLVTHSYMRKNGGEAPGLDAVGTTWTQAVETCGPSACISCLFHLVHSGQLLDRALSEHV